MFNLQINHMELIWFFVILIVFILLTVLIWPFKISINFHLNVLTNHGFYCIGFAGFNLFCGRTKLGADLKLEFENQKDIEKDSYILKILPSFIEQLWKHVEIDSAFFSFEGGKENDAYTSAMLCGSVNVLCSMIFAIAATKSSGARLAKNVRFSYAEDALSLSLNVDFRLSMINVLSSFIFAGIETKKKNILNK